MKFEELIKNAYAECMHMDMFVGEKRITAMHIESDHNFPDGKIVFEVEEECGACKIDFSEIPDERIMEKCENCCGNCVFFHELKHFKGGYWQANSVCTYLPQTEQGYDAFAIVVEKDNTCETFTRRPDE